MGGNYFADAFFFSSVEMIWILSKVQMEAMASQDETVRAESRWIEICVWASIGTDVN